MKIPLLTAVNFSGGRQSAFLVEAVLCGEIPKPPGMAVFFADPGMENWQTYATVRDVAARCAQEGIYFEAVQGPNLYEDLVSLGRGHQDRADNPPYWTKDSAGKIGQLTQKCTREYKIRPLDRAVRRYLSRVHGIGMQTKRLPVGCVVKWIGFGADEKHRCTEAAQKYQRLEYPLISLGLTRADIDAWFDNKGIPLPPPSACVACFSAGLRTLQEMHEERPGDWAKAVAVDEAIRYGMPGAKNPCFVSRTCIPLRTLPTMGFDASPLVERGPGPAGDDDDYACDSGVCFV